MFDVNPDAAKHYFKDLERQVAASRQPRGTAFRSAESSAMKGSTGSFIAVCAHLPARAFASAMRGVTAMLF